MNGMQSTPLRKKVEDIPAGEIAYTKRMACHLHFTQEKYDYFNYKQKIKYGSKAFSKLSPKQKMQFARLETIYHKNTEENIDIFMVTAYLKNQSKMPHITELMASEYAEAYNQNMSWLQSAEYKFLQDMKRVIPEKTRENFNNLFSAKNNSGLPIIYKHVIQGQININTATILESIFGFSHHLEDNMIDPLGIQMAYDIKKYARFLSINTEKYLQILKEKL